MINKEEMVKTFRRWADEMDPLQTIHNQIVQSLGLFRWVIDVTVEGLEDGGAVVEFTLRGDGEEATLKKVISSRQIVSCFGGDVSDGWRGSGWFFTHRVDEVVRQFMEEDPDGE